jgi:Cu/Ag efflux pump CusA
MRFLLQLPMVLLLSWLPARAQEALPPNTQEKMEVGQGVICDTVQQVERYVALRNNSTEMDVALAAVNSEAHVPVCSIARVVFSAGPRVAGLSAQGRLLSIIEINVHAFGNGSVWMRISATIRYTVTAEKGQIV